MIYKNLFFDLDDTLWAFSLNARNTFREVYQVHGLYQYFTSFEHFYELYQKRNLELWEDYRNERVTKDELNKIRFSYPLLSVGVDNAELVSEYSADFFARIPTKQEVMPHAKEVLEVLKRKYNLYVLSNGFHELQYKKMQSAGLDSYFKKVVLSEDIGVLKPNPKLFYYALSATQSEVNNSLVIGDSWEADMVGAQRAGIHQVYYNVEGKTDLTFQPTYMINDLIELLDFL